MVRRPERRQQHGSDLEEPNLEPTIDSSSRRRGSAPAVHSLHRFVFTVPDLSAAVKFYTDFGLDVRRMGGRADLRTFGNAHRWGEIFQGQGPKRLEYISFGAYPEDYDGIIKRLRDMGVELVSPHSLADKPGTWFADPDGTLVELVVSPKVTPAEKSVNPAAAGARCQARAIRMRRRGRRRSSARRGSPSRKGSGGGRTAARNSSRTRARSCGFGCALPGSGATDAAA